MVNREKKGKNKKEKIRIDYENIDVADIMGQIKRKISQKPKRLEGEGRKGDGRSPLSSYYHLEPEEAPGPKTKIRKFLLKITKPFAPLLKLFILPVYEEFREAVRILDQTNKRLDLLNNELNDTNQKLDRARADLGKTMEYTKLLHNLDHNIVVELSRLKIEEDNLRLKTRIMEKDFELLGKRERALERQIFK